MLSSIVTSIGWTMVPAAGARNEENRSVTNPNSSGLSKVRWQIGRTMFFSNRAIFYFLERQHQGPRCAKPDYGPSSQIILILIFTTHTLLIIPIFIWQVYTHNSYSYSYPFHISHPQFNEEQIYICYISHFLFCCVFPDPASPNCCF